MSRPLLFTGHFIFALFALGALWFWQERTLILDAAFQSYLFIASGCPAIMVERFGAAAVQLLPLAGVKAGASLSAVLMLYSVAVVLFQWGMFAIAAHGLRDKRTALILLIFNILLVGDSFYWMQNELLQGIAVLLLTWGWWLQRAGPPFSPASGVMFWVGSAALAVTIIYFHPLIVFPVAFLWVFFWFKQEAPRLPLSFLLTMGALFGLAWASKYVFRQPNFYDRGMTGQYVREFHFSLDKLLAGRGFQDLSAHLTGNYFLLLPLLALVLGFYLWKQQWWKAALVFGSVLGYMVLILQRFRDDDRWYIADSHYQAVAVFLLVPLVWEVGPGIKSEWQQAKGKVQRAKKSRQSTLLLAFCLLLLVIRLTGIYQTHQSYTTRLGYLRGILEETGPLIPGRKFVVNDADANQGILMMNWGLPYETLQMSALEAPYAVRVVAVAEDAHKATIDWPADSMVTFLMLPKIAFRDWPIRYYLMPDTGAWQLLPLQASPPATLPK